MLIIREIRQNIQNQHRVSQSWVSGTGVLPAAAGRHQEVPDWTPQWAGSGLRNARTRIWIRVASSRKIRVLFRSQTWVKTVRPSWSPSFKLSMACMAWNTSLVFIRSPVLSTLPASMTLSDSSLVGPKRSINDLGCCSDNYKQVPFSACRFYP